MSEAKENPGAESPKHQDDAVSAPKQEHQDQSQQHHKHKEANTIFNKTKEGAFKGWKKARDSASVGIFWKDRFRKPAPAAGKTPPATPPPPPPSSP